jgi:hypothetical protein
VIVNPKQDAHKTALGNPLAKASGFWGTGKAHKSSEVTVSQSYTANPYFRYVSWRANWIQFTSWASPQTIYDIEMSTHSLSHSHPHNTRPIPAYHSYLFLFAHFPGSPSWHPAAILYHQIYLISLSWITL